MTIQLLRDEERIYLEAVQRPGNKLVYATDWTERIANLWTPGTLIAANSTIRVKPVTGFQYSSTAGGLTGKTAPAWPTTIGQTVLDGSVTWVCAAVDTTSLLRTIASQVWTLDSGIAATGAIIAGNITSAMIDSTGAVDGTDYYARNVVTFSDGSEETAVFLIKVRSGAT